MIRSRSRNWQLLVGIVLILILLFVFLVLYIGPDSDISNFIFGRLWTSLLFAILFLGSFFGFLTLLAHQLPKGMSPDGYRRWEQIRGKGKSSYVRSLVLYCSLPIVVGLGVSSLLSSDDGTSKENLLTYLLVTSVFVGGIILLAFRNWSENEKHYLDMRSQSQPDQSSIVSPGRK